MMETARKVSCTAVSALLLFLGLCNALPINLENSGPDSHTQFLTGLVAVLLTVCSVVLLAGCLCCQRRNGFKEFRDSPVAASVANSLDHGHINPIANSEFTIFTPISPPHHNNNVFLANQRIVSRSLDDYKYGDIDVTYWFDGSEEDFPRKNLKYIKELGKGWFGRVVEGTAQGLSRNPEEWCPVAVRILEASASSRDRVLFLYDATIYRCGSHPNILRVLGRSLDTIPLLLLQEYCAEGDLKRYLRNNKATCDKFLSSHYPLLWCYQLTSAVKFLHGCRVTHPDLAARNCQLTKDLQLKLGDYGLSATLYPEDYYEGAPAVPLRWCAPETISYTSTTIQLKQITFEGNVWSLGVTLWEICECGDQPYSRLTDDEVVAQVIEAPKVRLPRPSYSTIYTDYLYRLMQSCWSTFESRSSIHQIELMLADLVQVYEHTRTISYDEASSVSMQDFDKRWESLKPNKAENSEQDLRSLNALNLHVSNVEEILSEKRLSASMNNLHGSLDNLLEYKNSFDPMESWLENVACNTGDMSYVKGLSKAIKDLDNAIAFENVSSDSSHQQSPIPDVIPRQSKLQFKLGQVFKPCELSRNEPRTSSSESETEDEAWRRKIERGAYSEKVRQKSRSVTDLMVLTHIDCSESDSETTVPSIDYKTNHSRNVRHIKNNMEGFNKFGSEGNLLSVQGTFQEELRKLQEERKDSLLFVPDNRSQSSSSVTRTGRCDLPAAQSSPVKKLFDELNSPVDIVPAKQVYNVFSVSVGQNYGALHNLKTSNQINKIKMTDGSSDVGDDSNCLNISTAERDVTSNVCNVCSTVNSETATDTNYNRIKQLGSRGNRQDLIKTWLAEDIFSVNEEELRNNKPEVKGDESEALIKRENSNNLKKDFLSSQLHPVGGGFDYEIKRQVPKLADIIQNDIKLLDYIIVNDGGDKLAGYCELEDCRQGNLNSSVSIEDNERVQSSETSFLNFDGGESQKFLRNKDDCKIFNDRNAMRDFLFESHTQITLEPTTRETPVEVMLNDLNHKSVPNSFCDSHANVQESRIAQIEANDLSDGDAVKLEDVRLVEVASEKCLRAPEARTTSIVDVSRIVEVNPEGETQRKAEKPAVQKEPVDLMTSSKVDDLNLLNGEPNFITENRFGNIFEDVSNETIAEAPRDEGLEISEAVRAENKAKSNAEDPTGITSSGFHLREVVENDAVLRGDAERSKELEIISDTSARRSREKETEEARERPSDSESLVKEEQREEELNLAETSGPKRESHEETTGESLDATEEEEEIESEGEKSDVLREENAAETKTEKEESDSAHLNDRLIFLSATEEENGKETAELREDPKILNTAVDAKGIETNSYLFDGAPTLNTTEEEKLNVPRKKTETEEDAGKGEEQAKILNTAVDVTSTTEGVSNLFDDQLTSKADEKEKVNVTQEARLKKWVDASVKKLETSEESYDEFLKTDEKEEGANETAVLEEQMKILDAEELVKLVTSEAPESLLETDEEKRPMKIGAEKQENSREIQTKILNTGEPTRTNEEGYNDAHEITLKVEEDGKLNTAREQTEKEEDKPIFKKQMKCNTEEQLLKLETTEGSYDDKEDPVSLAQKLKCNAEEQLKSEATEEGYNESPLKMEEDGKFNVAREQAEKEEDTPTFKKQMKSNAEEQLLKLETTEESYDDEEDPVSLAQKLKCNAEEQLKLEATEEGYNESPLKMEEDGTFNIAREQTEKEEDMPIFKKQMKCNAKEQLLKLETTEESYDDKEDPVSLTQKLKCNAEEQLKLETTEEGYNESPLKMEKDGKFNVAREQTEKEEDPNETPIFKKQMTFKLNTGEQLKSETTEESRDDEEDPVSLAQNLKCNAEEQLKSETTEEDEEDPVSLAQVFLDVAEDVTGVNKEISRDLLDKDAELEKLNSEISRNKTKGLDTSSETIIDKLTQIIRAEKQIATEFKSNRIQTGDFLSKEVQHYEDGGRGQPQIQFDLSESQQEIAPNSLTHYSAFAGAPGVKRPLDSIVILGASDDYSIDYYSGLKTSTEETGELQFSSNFVQGDGGAQKSLRCRAPENHHSDLKYSLETWDNFLDKTFDDQNSRSTDFSNFSEEPQSLLFLDTENCKGPPVAPSRHVGEKLAFDVGEEVKSEDKQSQKGSDSDGGSWEAGEGWFLHPQTGSEEPTGQIAPSQAGTSESYVGFSMDDEIMTALRNELLSKLPHAQRASSDKVEDQEEPDEGAEKNEVFVRYNVYSTPLSPIPEETFVDSDESRCATPQRYDSSEDDDDNSDWSMQDNNSPCNTQSPKLTESPAKEPPNRHTPSQDSCCSNDTLFNLEELNTANDHEKVKADDEIKQDDEEENVATVVDDHVITGDDAKSDETGARSFDVPKISIHNYIQEFLNNERHAPDENKSENEEIYLSVGDGTFAFGGRQSVVAPLNSPEDKPWKELQASFRRCEEDEMIEDKDILEALNESDHSNEPEANNESPDGVKETQDEKNPSTLEAKTDELEPSGDVEGARKVLGGDSYDDLYGPLTDIRFSGPADIELMTTAFNEGADLMEEQDWDSGSDTRSSSSGEFIWRNLSNAAPTMEHIVEEEREEESPGCTSDSEIEEECPEFVPSAWDKYATPTKSALRSPEKSLERAAVAAAEKGKKSKAVWFKKQKYHCVYEYPREPESPLLQSYDLWQPVTDYSAIADWDLDGSNSYVSTVDEPDCTVQECEVKNPKNLYHLTTFPDLTMGTTMLDEDFFISSSSRPFDMLGGLTSQFFPGKQFLDNWNENATPDSGVEDVTTPPVADSTTEEGKEPRLASQVQSLKSLAAAVVKQNDARNTVLGGLRHTRNKLKLDLPPSPSAFTSSRSFTVEPVVDEEILNRQAPTFTTFGKSRFLVQQVDTTLDDDKQSRNVSFEAIPYRPAKQFYKDDFDREKHKVEVVKGEASLLDSADEDSGIESCTLERKKGVDV